MSDLSPTAYFVTLALDGTVTDQGIAVTVPLGATAISKEQYDTIVAMLPAQCRLLNGTLTFIALPAPATATLPEVKAAAIITIDTAAEVARMRFLTAGSGQTLEYQATADEADRALAATTSLRPADYPWLTAEQDALHQVGIEVTTLDVAQQVHQVMAAWSVVGSTIKLTRRAAKLRVDAATDTGAVHDILAGLSWPSNPG